MDQEIETSDLFAVRKAKLEELRAAGLDPFRANWEQTHSSAAADANARAVRREPRVS